MIFWLSSQSKIIFNSMKIGLGRNKIEQTLLDKKINQMKKNLKKYGFKSNKSSTKRWKRTQREQKQKSNFIDKNKSNLFIA